VLAQRTWTYIRNYAVAKSGVVHGDSDERARRVNVMKIAILDDYQNVALGLPTSRPTSSSPTFSAPVSGRR
jgi:hypothetical protein